MYYFKTDKQHFNCTMNCLVSKNIFFRNYIIIYIFREKKVIMIETQEAKLIGCR